MYHWGSGLRGPAVLMKKMKIAGFQKTSFLDYPGQPAAVVFTPGCNMNCCYCHNEELLFGAPPLIPEEEVLSYLDKRRGILQAVTVTGGEPTLQQDLADFLKRVRGLGYRTKLDTNGLKPEVLQHLMAEGLLDYVAMDIKAPPEKYDGITRTKNDLKKIRKSIALLRSGSVPHEFRLTFYPGLTAEDAVAAAELVKGTERFYLQQYRKRPNRDDPEPHLPSYVEQTACAIRAAIGVCTLRGLGVQAD